MRLGKLLLWSPRILGVLVCLFLSLFALDAFGGGKTFIIDWILAIAGPLLIVGILFFWSWLYQRELRVNT